MSKKELLDLFYGVIVPEAAMGKINILFNNYGILFNTKIVELKKVCANKIDNKEIMVPTLVIKNKELFDDLLDEYVKLAKEFYDDSNFLEEIIRRKATDKKEMVSKEKAIITHLFANMTWEDFNNPCNFLKRRIDFINNSYKARYEIGYSDILGCNLRIEVTDDTINNETPSQLIVIGYNEDGDKFVFPKIKFGISDNKVYFYAIQNYGSDKSNFAKQINRKLYKVGEGINKEEEFDNVRDITASFLVALNIAINYFNSMGYNAFLIPSILTVRWNSKQIIIMNKFKSKKIDEGKKLELEEMQEFIQNNLTNKLIRTFLRLGVHYNNIDVISLPGEIDSILHIEIDNSKKVTCNNKLLYETGLMVNSQVESKRK